MWAFVVSLSSGISTFPLTTVSFIDFQPILINSLICWGVIPSMIFYTSSKLIHYCWLTLSWQSLSLYLVFAWAHKWVMPSNSDLYGKLKISLIPNSRALDFTILALWIEELSQNTASFYSLRHLFFKTVSILTISMALSLLLSSVDSLIPKLIISCISVIAQRNYTRG